MGGFAAVLLLNFGSQVGGYMTFDQAEETGSRAHVVGTWVEDKPTRYDRSSNVFTFHMRDESGTVRKVHYQDPKPANFEQATQVVVEGQMKGEAFRADEILVKCPSKYNETQDLKKQAGQASEAAPTTDADAPAQ